MRLTTRLRRLSFVRRARGPRPLEGHAATHGRWARDVPRRRL